MKKYRNLDLWSRFEVYSLAHYLFVNKAFIVEDSGNCVKRRSSEQQVAIVFCFNGCAIPFLTCNVYESYLALSIRTH